jgi:thiamine biosynthesis lipoprotein
VPPSTAHEGLEWHAFPAMGTTVEVALPPCRRDALELVKALFCEWERTLSRFRDDSDLSIVNARAGEVVRVTALTLRVVLEALRAAAATGGIFDPTMLHQLVTLGYDASFPLLSPLADASSVPPAAGGAWPSVAVDEQSSTIRVPLGVGLDLGGIAKGMAVDAALTEVAAAGVPAAAISAGGDLAVHGTPPDANHWDVDLEAASGWRQVELRAGAIATSSTARRRWQSGQHARHHLLDPRSGLPSCSGLRSVSVVAADCRQAEVAAKVALILGASEGRSFLEARGLSALLVDEDGRSEFVGPWADEAGED